MQWAITSELGRYMLQFVEQHPELIRYYRYCFAPDEHLFHTIVANSPFCARAGGIEPYVEYGTARMANLHHIHPSLNKTYTADDFEELSSSDKLFTKKITSSESLELIEMIDTRLR
jgi:hypothetical protein